MYYKKDEFRTHLVARRQWFVSDAEIFASTGPIQLPHPSVRRKTSKSSESVPFVVREFVTQIIG